MWTTVFNHDILWPCTHKRFDMWPIMPRWVITFSSVPMTWYGWCGCSRTALWRSFLPSTLFWVRIDPLCPCKEVTYVTPVQTSVPLLPASLNAFAVPSAPRILVRNVSWEKPPSTFPQTSFLSGLIGRPLHPVSCIPPAQRPYLCNHH